ncbi:MAG: DUF1566 domain-containing protein [Bacteroidota bacterium]
MKRIFTILAVIFLTATVWAQSPQKMSYQAVIRNSSNQLVVNHAVGMKISILQSTATGAAVYVETLTPTTNANGLINIEIGGGTGFDTIHWANGPYFIKTETDPTGGTTYTITGTSQLLSVPYALYAKTAENGFSGNYNDLTNKPVTNGSETKINAGTNVTVTGLGTTASPYVVNATNGGSMLAPSATIQAATNIIANSAILNGIVNANGFLTTVVFEWGLTTSYGNTSFATQSPVAGNVDVPASSALTGLLGNTTYHYRIKATNAINITYSNDMSLIFPLTAPQLTTTSISSITGISAISGGNVTYDGGSTVTARGVCWSTNPAPTLSNSFSSNGTGDGNYISNITSLLLGTTYYVCAYATNVVGTSYGNVLSFTTVALPTVTTATFSDIKGNSAKAGGSVTNNGGSTITAQGLCWSTSVTPTISNSITTSFTDIMTGLTPNTVYYVRAYATNIAGTGYGAQISFNSGKLIGSTFGGGLVFYNDGNSHGLVCANADQATGATWGCNGTAIGGTSTSINSGATNTNAIVLGCSTIGIAAKLCYDLVLNTYSDWYLPSKDELNLMYVNLKIQSLGSFDTGLYWSSSEYSGGETANAWVQNFGSGSQDGTVKFYPTFVRAVRAF